MIVEISRGFSPNQTRFFRDELRDPVRQSSLIDYRLLTELEERLSRKEFVEGLKQAGFQGQPNARDENIAVPEKIEELLGEMNFLSQFRALRELHATIRSTGESAALLGALSRGYAHLGVLTEYYWHPAHKVFKARALLYAQRGLARDEKSPVARWHRAYAAALAGLHSWALADLKEADGAWKAMAEKDRPPQPPWVQLIGPFCHYQVEQLGLLVKDQSVRQLAALLKFLAVEQAGGNTWAAQTALEILPEIPECYRVHDSLCRMAGVSTLHRATLEPVKLVGEKLYGEVGAMPGLPDDVRVIIESRTSAGGWLATLLGREPASGDDYQPRRQLIDALDEGHRTSRR